jgi:hypothetical protein
MNKIAWVSMAILLQGCLNFSIDNIVGTLENKACDSFVGMINLDGAVSDFSVTTQPARFSYGTASLPPREEIEVIGTCKVGLADFKISQKYSLKPYVVTWTISVEDPAAPKLVFTPGITR